VVFNEYELSRVSLRKGVIALSWAVSEMGWGGKSSTKRGFREGGGAKRGNSSTFIYSTILETLNYHSAAILKDFK
jgi:hypothetical protein